MRRLRQLESLLALCIAWALVFMLPFRVTVRLFSWARPDSAPGQQSEQVLVRARAVVRRVGSVERWFPGRVTCLVRALAGWLLLARRGISSTVRFGVRREDGQFQAHAWLLVANQALVGAKDAHGFMPLADMGAPAQARP